MRPGTPSKVPTGMVVDAAAAMCTRLSALHGMAVQYIPFDELLGKLA